MDTFKVFRLLEALLFLQLYNAEKLYPKTVDCPRQPLLQIRSDVQTQRNIMANLSLSLLQRTFYFPEPVSVTLQCSARFPIEIALEREMPSLVQDFVQRRVVLDDSSYCYKIRFRLPQDFRITGNYTCRGLLDKTNQASSIFLFANGNSGPELLNNGLTRTIIGAPDDMGWIRIPCIVTDPFQKPTLYRRPNQSYDQFVKVGSGDFVRYDPRQGFFLNVSWVHCCNMLYRCSLLQNLTGGTRTLSTTILLRRGFITNGVHFRIPNMNSEQTELVVLGGPGHISIFCEANEPIRLEWSFTGVTDLQNKTQIHPSSFYRYFTTFSGKLNSGTLDITCIGDKKGNQLHVWKYTIEKGGSKRGIHFNQSDQSYPFTCYGQSNKLDPPIIYSIQCDNPINCETAKRFSILVNRTQGITKRFPFHVAVGRPCLDREICAQSNVKPETSYGLMLCKDGSLEKTYYFQDYMISLDGEILTSLGSSISDECLVRMEFINRTIYCDEPVRFKCEAAAAVFALGIQFVLTLQNGTTLPARRLTVSSAESIRNGRITLEANIRLGDPSIRSISCSAPYWNNSDWRTVSQELDLQMGEIPRIKQDTGPSIFKLSLNDVDKVIECEAWGEPSPKISWTKDSDQLVNSTSKLISESENRSTITFRKVKESHTGDYLCEASNVRGNASRKFVVKIIDLNSIKSNIILYGSIGGSILVVFIIILFILIRKILKNRKTIDKLTELEIREFEHGREDLVRKFAELHENARYLPYKEDFEIPKEKIDFNPDEEVLGSGNFGIVLKGYLSRKGERLPVAVKTVRSASDYNNLRSLLSEIKIMMYIGIHPNIVSFIGAMTKELREGKLHVVVEYCGLGSMKGFLLDNREAFVDQVMENEIDPSRTKSVKSARSSTRSWMLDDFLPAGERGSVPSVTTLTLVRWAYQVASGMEYLGDKKVIHGDLATRNLLLNHSWTVKITDFGLSSHLYDYTNYIKKQKEELVPWRWLSTEAIRDSKFSVQTDVWSYGITVWEIFTLAEVPYQGFSWGKEFVQELYDGYRLPAPQYGTPDIYRRMLSCWEFEPKNRPTFVELKDYFYGILAAHNQLPFLENNT